MRHKGTHGPAVQVILQRCTSKWIYSSGIHGGPWELCQGAEVIHMNHLEWVPDCEWRVLDAAMGNTCRSQYAARAAACWGWGIRGSSSLGHWAPLSGWGWTEARLGHQPMGWGEDQWVPRPARAGLWGAGDWRCCTLGHGVKWGPGPGAGVGVSPGGVRQGQKWLFMPSRPWQQL